MTVGSLFAGIGGFELGFERAGFQVMWQVEIDPFCRRVLARHWPDVERFDDVRTVGRHNLSAVDVLCGGFPCQDVSDSGNKAGIDGSRSGLWREMFRIVRELRPLYVVVENVTGLFDRGMGRVLGDLASVGYDSEWGSLSACAFSAPHTRERVFIMAYPNAGRWRASRPSAVEIAPADRVIAGCECGRSESGPAHWQSESGISRVVDGFPDDVDRGAALGNAIVPQIAEWIARRILDAESREESTAVNAGATPPAIGATESA